MRPQELAPALQGRLFWTIPKDMALDVGLNLVCLIFTCVCNVFLPRIFTHPDNKLEMDTFNGRQKLYTVKRRTQAAVSRAHPLKAEYRFGKMVHKLETQQVNQPGPSMQDMRSLRKSWWPIQKDPDRKASPIQRDIGLKLRIGGPTTHTNTTHQVGA